jgi:beta-glucosidase
LGEAGKPIVLVLIEGRPRLVRTIVDGASAVVLALNPGMEGGTAIADVLLGDTNPSGKMPITYPRFANALTTYDHKASEEAPATGAPSMGYAPQFEFGSGLSYTTFDYANLTVAPATASETDRVAVSVTVRNRGRRAGAEVVELFVSERAASVTPAVRRLKRFARVTLQPGDSREMRFTLARDDFSFVGADGKRVVEPGTFSIAVGGLAREVALK